MIERIGGGCAWPRGVPVAFPHFFVLGFVGVFDRAAVQANLSFAVNAILLENQGVHSAWTADDAVFHFERFVVALRDEQIVQLVGVDLHELQSPGRLFFNEASQAGFVGGALETVRGLICRVKIRQPLDIGVVVRGNGTGSAVGTARCQKNGPGDEACQTGDFIGAVDIDFEDSFSKLSGIDVHPIIAHA